MFSKSSGGFKYKGKFDLSHENKFSCDMGQIIPCQVMEVLPGDTFKQCMNKALVELLAQTDPVMHEVNIFFRSFFVPNRVLWNKWDDFITGGKDGASTPTKPYLTLSDGDLVKGSLFDYMGLPINLASGGSIKVDALPFLAYNRIINEYFLDQQLDTELYAPNDTDGLLDKTKFKVQNARWEKDYFTSAKVSPQAGSGAVMPLGDSAPVIGNGKTLGLDAYSSSGVKAHVGLQNYHDDGTPGNTQLNSSVENYGKDAGSEYSVAYHGKASVGLTDDPDNSGVIADLSNATPVSIETLRNAFTIQSYLEKLNRAGHHIKDWLMAFFGEFNSDSRLQNPEYLGGFKQSMLFSKILQSSQTDTTPLGTQAGWSNTIAINKPITKHFTEYGWFMTMFYILPRTQYMQGLHKQFTRETRLDYYLPEFAKLGEQAIKLKELYCKGTDDDEKVFGYQTRFQEYRTRDSYMTGYFRDVNSFETRTLVRDFENEPALNSSFIEAKPSKRIYATPGFDNHVLVDCANICTVIRKMPRYVVPSSLS